MGVRITICVLAITALVAGCRSAHDVCDPEYAHVSHSLQHTWCSPAYDAMPPALPHLEGSHAVDEYIQIALARNPEIQAAHQRIEAAAFRVPVAASLPDPMLNLTVQPEPVQTAAGQQEFILSASQKFHPLSKRQSRAAIAEAKTEVARAQLMAAELQVIAKVKRAYFELYYIQQATEVFEAEAELIGEIREIALTRYKTGGVSQQDVLRADLEISNTQTELIRLRQQLASGQARLARLLHVSPQSNLLAQGKLSPQQAPQDLDWLQHQAVAARPELHAKLAAIGRDQQAVALARSDYKPDVTLGFSWIEVADRGVSPVSNGRDSLLLTAGVNLPIYKKRLNSAVRSAEAQAVSTAREYDALRDVTLEEVTDLFAQARSQQEMLTLFSEDILPKAEQTLEVSLKAYNVGEVDFLQLLDNWRQLLRYEVNHHRLEASLRQTLAELEQVVGGFSGPSYEAVPTPEGEIELLPSP